MQPRLFHLHTLSALHCGTGQAADVVDLPIARARATKLPIVPGSSLRGVLRAHCDGADIETALFGPARIENDKDAFAGALSVGDAHLLVLPVRSLAGIVSFVTSPFILGRYRRDLVAAGGDVPEVPPSPACESAMLASNSVNEIEQKLVLEDLDLSVDGNAKPADEWAECIGAALHNDDDIAKDFRARFAIVSDDVMGYLAETATEVRARIAIDQDTGTVRNGALWYEENLPAETGLWGVYALTGSNEPGSSRSSGELEDALRQVDLLQLGGNAGVGSGIVRFAVTDAP